jgi:putative transposase
MARKLRVLFKGAIYHVTIRGIGRRRLFDDDTDRERFLERLGEAVDTFGVRLYLFALMTNHVHLLCETPKANLSEFMHQLQTAYSVYYNRRHRRSGHLMQGRFGAELVAGDAYLLRLSRYIHLNPVFVSGVKQLPLKDKVRYLRGYRWSSFRGYAGLSEQWSFVEEGPILAQMGVRAGERRKAYRQFVESGVAETDEEMVLLVHGSRWGIGDEEFQAQVRERYEQQVKLFRRSEDVSFRRVVTAVPVGAVLESVSREFGVDRESLRRRAYGCVARAVAALLLMREAGMREREVAGMLGMGTGAAVSHQIQRLRQRMAEDADLRRRVERLSSKLARREKSVRRGKMSNFKG